MQPEGHLSQQEIAQRTTTNGRNGGNKGKAHWIEAFARCNESATDGKYGNSGKIKPEEDTVYFFG